MMHPLKPFVLPRRLAGSRPSTLKLLRMHAAELSQTDQSVIDLSGGSPWCEPTNVLGETLAMAADNVAYGDPRGHNDLRMAVAEIHSRQQQVTYDHDMEVTITNGASGALATALLALVDQCDCVAMFEPFYESYPALVKLAGGTPKFIPLNADGSFNEEHLRSALFGTTRVLILNSPHNPTGHVFSNEQLLKIVEVCREYGTIVLCDDTYENYWFERQPVNIARFGLRDQTVTVKSLSKSLRVPGWRVGAVLAPPEITAAVRHVNDMTSGGPAVPVQVAVAEALYSRDSQDQNTMERALLRSRRNSLTKALVAGAGFKVTTPGGGLFAWADGSDLGLADDEAVARYMLDNYGLVVAPGSAFLGAHNKLMGRTSHCVRVSFSRDPQTMAAAEHRLWSRKT